MLIAEADLGERVMRALILWRIGLIERGVGGPVIVGRADMVTCCAWAAFHPATAIPIRPWI